MEQRNKKSLVVYYSRMGQNYSNGKVVSLEVGNTEVASKMIVEMSGADIFKIVPVKEYPIEYKECTKVAIEEFKAKERPAYKDDINIDEYDVVYVGYPNWCGTMPMVVWTFLQQHDFKGKVVKPFCTHEGSGLANSLRDVKELCVNAEVKEGLAIHGSSVNEAKSIIKAWLE